MRWIAILMLVVFGITGFWLVAEKNQALVVLLMPPHRFELSANLLLIILIATFFTFYFLLRIVGVLLNIPRQLKKRQAEKKLNKFNIIFSKSVEYFLQALYEESFLEIGKAIKLGHQKELILNFSALLAARIKNKKLRDKFRKEVKDSFPEGSSLSRYLEATFNLSDGRYQRVIDTLSASDGLKDKESNILQLIFEAEMSLKNYKRATEILDILEKREDLDSSLHQDARLLAIESELSALKDNPAAIKKYWSNLKKHERLKLSIVTLMLTFLIEQKEYVLAKSIIEKFLDNTWSDSVLSFYSEACQFDLKSGLEKAESWLVKRPKNPNLMRILGGLCVDNKIWGKANSYLKGSLELSKSPEVFWELARLHEATSRPDEAVKFYKNGLAIVLNITNSDEI